MLCDADQVWNRAAWEHGGPRPGEGDLALAALLLVHNLAINGGLLHSVDVHSADETGQAVAGFRYFGLEDAAEVVDWVAHQSVRIDRMAALDAAERLEREADQRYAAAVPDDSTLAARFEQVFRERPEAFAPIR